MKILVTGAAGFFGSHTVRKLVERGKQVCAMVHSTRKVKERLGDLENDLEIRIASVTDPHALDQVMKDVETVVHLVAIPIERGDQSYDRINHQGTVNVVNAAVKAGVERFIYLSQYEANPQSFSPFMQSKGKGNLAVESSPLQWTMLHPSLTFGRYDRVFSTMARLIRLTPWVFPNFNGGKTEFQPTYIHDVVEVIVQCIDNENTIHQHYNFGGPEVLTLKTITQRVIDAMNTRRTLLPIPILLLQPPVYLMHRLLPQPPASVPLLKLLGVPNVVLHNNDYDYFNITPRPFAGEHLEYLREITAGDAIKTFFGMKPA